MTARRTPLNTSVRSKCGGSHPLDAVFRRAPPSDRSVIRQGSTPADRPIRAGLSTCRRLCLRWSDLYGILDKIHCESRADQSTS
jgi:hypothetical protein